MSDRPKAKSISSKTRNDSRPNGKAGKKNPGVGKRHQGVSRLQATLQGQGRARSFKGIGWEPSTQSPIKSKVKS